MAEGMSDNLSGKQKKMTKALWAEVKVRAESGEPYEAISSQYPVTVGTITQRVHHEKWSTPSRINKALRGELPPDDPAQAAANVWRQRKEDAREKVFEGTKKALERFFALSPIPQSFSEAALAKKMMDEAIQPDPENHHTGSVNLAILTAVGFAPKIQE